MTRRMTHILLNTNQDPHIRLTKSGAAWRDITHMPWEEFHLDVWLACGLCGAQTRSGFTPDGMRRRFCGKHFRLYWANGVEMRQED